MLKEFNINNLNKVFENRLRLGVMSMLMVSEKVDFNAMKSMLGATDGNLSSHLSALEKAAYVKVSKQFVGKKPNTSYSITHQGKKAFNEHLNSLESLIRRDAFRNILDQG
jgi:DNA-binding HxlR family transcriptional regulator